MAKVAVVYWSGTGNTAAMAEAVAAGAKNKGAEVSMLAPTDFNSSMVGDFTGIAFGCPAMGAEVLEETEFQPMWDDVKNKLSGKSVALFGSYGWGTGEWMSSWESEANDCGAMLACDSVICCEAPNDDAVAACTALGEALA